MSQLPLRAGIFGFKSSINAAFIFFTHETKTLKRLTLCNESTKAFEINFGVQVSINLGTNSYFGTLVTAPALSGGFPDSKIPTEVHV